MMFFLTLQVFVMELSHLADTKQNRCGSIRAVLHGRHVRPCNRLSQDNTPVPAPWLEEGTEENTGGYIG